MALLRQLEQVGQAAARSQQLIDMVATPTGSPRKDGAPSPPAGARAVKGRSPLSPTSRGNVPQAPRSAQGGHKRRKGGRPESAVRSSSDVLCQEAVHLQEKLRAAMSILSAGSGAGPLQAAKTPTARRELAASARRGSISAPRPRRGA